MGLAWKVDTSIVRDEQVMWPRSKLYPGFNEKNIKTKEKNNII